MKRLAIVSLSIDKWTATNKIISSLKTSDFPKYDVDAYVFIQGDSLSSDGRIHVIRDDTVYNKGLTISEIRDYFFYAYKDILDKYEYLYLVDDDTLFRGKCIENILRMTDYMDNNPEVGIINSVKGEFSDTYKDFNPIKVGTRSGILVKSGEYYDLIQFGGEYGISYYEESYMALNYYLNGFICKRTNNSIYTVAQKGGVTNSLRNRYGYYLKKSYDFVTGWTVAESQGYYKFNEKYNDNTHLGTLTELCETTHINANKLLNRR